MSKNHFRETFWASRFATFATVSATNGLVRGQRSLFGATVGPIVKNAVRRGLRAIHAVLLAPSADFAPGVGPDDSFPDHYMVGGGRQCFKMRPLPISRRCGRGTYSPGTRRSERSQRPGV